MLSLSTERLLVYERRSAWFLTAAAVLFLGVYAWPILALGLSPGLVRACSTANLAIWIAFGFDYLVRLTLADSKRRFVRSHLLDLVVLVLPLLRPLRALRVVTALARLNRTSVSVRGRTTTYVVGAVLLLGFVSALAVLDAEREVAGANITTFADAIWWAATTITTVGYGDQFPTTPEGRFVGVGLMIGGIALAGTITAALASWFVEQINTAEQAEADTRDDQLATLLAEVKALRADLAQRPQPPA
ncbi:potassium channel family protein [Kribbella sp. NPDC051620]|uniref:potassium channel family protein n=1 Tax=Kribbella sp. NPDC051620 TaxID=3364120 RepID=UPI003796D032